MRPPHERVHPIASNVPEPPRLRQPTLYLFPVVLWFLPTPLLDHHPLPQCHTLLTNPPSPIIYTPATHYLPRTLAIRIVTTAMKSAPFKRFRRKISSPRKRGDLTPLNRSRVHQRLTPVNLLTALKQRPDRPMEAIGQSLSRSRLPFHLASSLPLQLSNLVREPGFKFPLQPSLSNNLRLQHPQIVRSQMTRMQLTTTCLLERALTQLPPTHTNGRSLWMSSTPPLVPV